MDPTAIYQDYLALKAHFSGSYDYQKYNGKIRASADSSSFRRDKFLYLKLAKHNDPHRFLLANISEDRKSYIRDLAYGAEAERIYTDYVSRTESLGYKFQQDLRKLEGNMESNLFDLVKHDYRNHPKIIVHYLAKEIMLETLCIITKETGVLPKWEKMYPYDSMIEYVIFKVKKYTPFINYDRARYRHIMAEEFLHNR